MTTSPAAPDVLADRSPSRDRGLPLPVLAILSSLAVAGFVVDARVPVLLVGAAAGVVLLARLDLAVLLVVATAPLESAIRISDNEQLGISKLAGAVCFASFGFAVLAGKVRLRFDRSHVALLALVAIALVSSLQARDVTLALETCIRYVSFVGLYVVFSHLDPDRDVLRRVVWTATVAGTVAATLALANLLLFGAPLARLAYDNPNDYAFILAATLPFTAWLVLEHRGPQRVAAALAACVMASAVLLSFSRGSALGLAVALVWHGITERRHTRALVAGGVLLAIAALVIVSINEEAVSTGLAQKSNEAEYNVSDRFVAWTGAAELFADHPVLGVGPGNFRLYFHEVTGTPLGVSALNVSHDAYLDMAAELGVGGFVLFVAYIVIVLSRLGVAIARRRGPPGFAALARTALLVILISFLTHSQQYFAPIWIVGGLATAIWRDRGDGEVRAVGARPGSRVAR